MQQEYLNVFLSVRQAAGGKDIEEQPEDVQDQVNIGVHGASIRGTRVPAQVIVPGLGRVFAHYRVPPTVSTRIVLAQQVPETCRSALP